MSELARVTSLRRAPALRVVPEPAEERPRSRRSDVLEAGQRDANRLVLLSGALVGFGLVIVLSASSVVSIAEYGSPWSLFERQVLWTALGIVAFALGTRLDLRRVRRLVIPFLVLSSLLLVIVLMPHLGKTAGGSSRWVGAGPIRIQPSEFAKLAFALFAADLLARREHARNQGHEVVRPLITVLAFLGALILKQPDMGTAIVLVCIGAAVLYSGGVHPKLLAGLAVAVVGAGGLLAIVAPYRRARLFSFFNPFAHASTTGYQVVQSIVALASGHLTGTGLGGSVAKWGFLPNAQTDFIFSVIGNELGLVGALAVLLGFASFGLLGLRIAARTGDRFASLLATALTCYIVCQAFINVGGVIGLLPETGIPLPFVSFGGSSLVVALGAVGLLANISRHPRLSTAPKSAARPCTTPATRGRR